MYLWTRKFPIIIIIINIIIIIVIIIIFIIITQWIWLGPHTYIYMHFIVRLLFVKTFITRLIDWLLDGLIDLTDWIPTRPTVADTLADPVAVCLGCFEPLLASLPFQSITTGTDVTTHLFTTIFDHHNIIQFYCAIGPPSRAHNGSHFVTRDPRDSMETSYRYHLTCNFFSKWHRASSSFSAIL